MINVFVSSTFKDMQHERDLMHTIVIPTVNNALSQKGECAHLLDFRWGVNTQDLNNNEALDKVLKTCFDGIENSSFFICFIGDNYGTEIDSNYFSSLLLEKHIPQNENKSITELEITYASEVKRISEKNILFYFKETEQANESYKIKQLKKLISERFPKSVKYYKPLSNNRTDKKVESFSKLLADDLINMILDGSYPRSSEIELAQNLANNYASRFCCREELLLSTLNDIKKNCLSIIYGESGCGKTVFMSALYSKLKNICFARIAYVNKTLFIGSNIKQILLETLRNALDELSIPYKLLSFEIDVTLNNLIKIFNNKISGKHIVILIDGIDKLRLSELDDFIQSIKPYSDRIHFVVSVVDPQKYIFEIQNKIYIELPELRENDVEKVIHFELQSYQKSLTKKAINCLKEKSGATSPLYICLAIKRLVHMQNRDYDSLTYGVKNVSAAINMYIFGLIKNYADSLEGMILDYMDFSKQIVDELFATNIVSYMSSTVYGYDEVSLFFLVEECGFYPRSNQSRHMLPSIPYITGHSNIRDDDKQKFIECDFYWFCKYLDDIIYRIWFNDAIAFENSIVRTTIYNHYQCKKECDKRIAALISLDDNDRMISDFEIANAIVRCENWNVYFRLVDEFSCENDNESLNMMSNIFLSAWYQQGNDILESLSSYFRKFSKKHKSKLVFSKVRFIVDNILPLLDQFPLSIDPFIQFFKDCIEHLKKQVDYGRVAHRLYIISLNYNLAVICKNKGNLNNAEELSMLCIRQLNAVPKSMRNTEYDELRECFCDTFSTWNDY